MQRVKLGSAVVLASCLALPLSTCTVYLDEKGEPIPVESGEPPPPGAQKSVTTTYPVMSWSESPRALLWLWPLIAVAYERVGTRQRLRAIVWWLEPPLVLLSAGLISLQTAFQRPAIGYYLASASLGAYLVVWIYQGTTRLRTRMRAA